MNNDITSAQILDADQIKIVPELIGRRGKKEFATLQRGMFIPYIPSKSIYIKSQQIANKLGIEDPIRKIIGEIANIRAQLFSVDLTGEFPIMENPFDTSIVSDVVSAVTNQLPPLPDPTLNTGTQFGNLDQLQASGLTTNQEFLLANQPLYQAMARKQNLNKQRQTTTR